MTNGGSIDDGLLTGLRRIPGVAATYLVDERGVIGGTPRAPGDSLLGAQGALLAALVGALRQAAADLGVGELGETILEAERGAIVVGSLGDGRAAVVLAEGRANLGMVRVELRRLRRGT